MLARLFAGIHSGIFLVGVNQLPAAILDSTQRSMRRLGIQPLAKKSGPVIRSDLIEGFHYIFELIGYNRGRAALASEKQPAEIIQRFLAAGLAANRGIHVQPDEEAFRIVIGGAAPIGPFGLRSKKTLDGGCSVLKRTPGASGAMVEHRSGVGSVFTPLLWRAQACSASEDVSQIIGETFVDPQQIAFHRLLIVGRCQSRGTAIFAVPRMDEL